MPGAVAFIPALINSGFPCDKFVFEGFLPHKKGRKTLLEKIAIEERTVILYESPHRIIKTLEQIIAYISPDRPIAISRELTKTFEENLRGTAAEMLEHFKNHKPKGEFVLIVGAENRKSKSAE